MGGEEEDGMEGTEEDETATGNRRNALTGARIRTQTHGTTETGGGGKARPGLRMTSSLVTPVTPRTAAGGTAGRGRARSTEEKEEDETEEEEEEEDEAEEEEDEDEAEEEEEEEEEGEEEEEEEEEDDEIEAEEEDETGQTKTRGRGKTWPGMPVTPPRAAGRH